MSEAGGRTELLSALLLDGVRALRSGDAAAAIEPLLEVCSDPDLQRAEDLQDIRARARSLLAQALLEVGRADDALPHAEQALALARTLGDPQGLRAIEELRGRVHQALHDARREADNRARSERLAHTPIAEIEARVRDPLALVEVLVRKANAEADAGRLVEALDIAQRALGGALASGDVRLEVLARLSVARAAPERAREQLEVAHARASEAHEFNLVTAVARAAEAHGVEVGLLRGPGGGDA